MNATMDAPAAPAQVSRKTWVVRAQHDGVSHFLVREAGNLQRQTPGGGVVNEPEVLTLGVHTFTARRQLGDGSWEASDPTLTPPDDATVMRFSSIATAEGAAARCNLNAAGFVWYPVETDWRPPAGYIPPPSPEAAAELEQANNALRQQIAMAENEALQAQLAAATRTKEAALAAAPEAYRTPELAAPVAEHLEITPPAE